MAIPNARKITVGGHEYTWSVRSAYNKDRYNLGWTPAALWVTVFDNGIRSFYKLTSKHWTSEHEEEWAEGNGFHPNLTHKVALTPAHIAKVIETNGTCELDDWLVEIG